MKRRLLHIVTIAFAMFFLWVSHGVNVYHYCCNTCSDYGDNPFLISYCDDIRSNGGCCSSHSNQYEESDIVSHFSTTSYHCDIHQFFIENQTVVNINYDFFARVYISPELFRPEQVTFIVSYSDKYTVRDNSPPESSGRELLSLFSTLLI